MRISTTSIAVLAAASMMVAGPALAQKKYGPGASDTEIKIGNTVPYSGPASAYGILGKSYAAYFKKINDEGGINGRKINFISYDDGYSPPKTVEQTRKLVESDEVMAIVGNVGTAANAAIQKYLNAKKTPQLFLATGATRWNVAFAAMAGVTMDLTPQMKLDVGYRYLQMGSARIDDLAGSYRVPATSHEIRIGLRYMFGDGLDGVQR